MKLQSFTLVRLDIPKMPDVIPVLVPEGAIFRFAQLMTDRISLYYECPSNIVGAKTRVDDYSVIHTGNEVPNNADFIACLSTIVEVPRKNEKTKKIEKEQGVMIFPLYKIKASLIFTGAGTL